jgi:regulator of RNase E activity RraA
MNDVTAIPNVLTDELRDMLSRVSVATITNQLQNRGLRSTFLSDLKPLLVGQSMVGRARTLRYVAHRQDKIKELGGGMNAQRRAAETAEPGDVLVIEARDVPDAGTVGDIYAMRAYHLGAVGIVTDGALRDTPAIAELGRPVYHRSSHASTWGRHHMPFSNDEPITCSGVYVEPGDVIVGDAEGAVVIPHALAEEVARDAVEQELREAFAIERVTAGESSVGVFPLSKDRQAEFEAWAEARKGQ